MRTSSRRVSRRFVCYVSAKGDAYDLSYSQDRARRARSDAPCRQPPQAQDTIKIGVTQPLTGAFAASGNYVAQGAKIAEEEINKAGGVLGKKIELIVEDNKSNPTEAVATAEKLIVRDKVPVMMGAWSSTLTLAVMPKLEEYKVPMLVETSSSGKITVSGNPYIFRISPTSEMEAKAFTPLFKTLGIKKADFLATNNDFGLGASKEFSEAAKSEGVQVGVMETMDPKATDFSAQLAKIKASGGDTLFVTTAVEQITLILKQAKDQQLAAAHHHHRRLELARPADRAGRRGRQRLLPPGVLHAVVPRGREEPRHRQEVRGAVERARSTTSAASPRASAAGTACMSSSRRIKAAGKAEAGGHHQGAVGRQGEGHQRRHRLHQAGPRRQGERAERAQRLSGQDRRRQGGAAVGAVIPRVLVASDLSPGLSAGCRQQHLRRCVRRCAPALPGDTARDDTERGPAPPARASTPSSSAAPMRCWASG